MLPGRELPHDPEDNPCFCCGPRNPVGLRMRFADDGERVRSRLVLDDAYCGWPGSVLEGILYAAMDDAIYWTAWARLGTLAYADAPREVAFPGRVRTKAPFTVEAFAEGPEDAEGWRRFAAEVVQDGRVHARLAMRLRRRTRAELAALLEIPDLPRSLREDVAEALARGA